jgi:cobalt-zinc-cadmium efflux system membrane fusion protein
MKISLCGVTWTTCVICASLVLAGCGKSVKAQDKGVSGTGPEPVTVQPDLDANNFQVDHPEQFPLATAGEHLAAPELDVTGVVNPDISRQVPVPSLTTGRVVEINARLGDEVQKGQLLFKVRSMDVAGAYSDYRQAVKNEQLTKVQLDRANLLFANGAWPKTAVENAQNAEDDNMVILDTAKEHLQQLGLDPANPTGIVDVFAPVAGTITDQQITNQSGVQALTPPNPFTISDTSHVWIICDVWENDMSRVHIGESADIRLAAYPDRVLKGRISNILPQVDPNIRTAKVRIEVENPGLMRLGMFVTAAFHGETMERRATVPATAILHLHDREWVYTPGQPNHFRRIEVVSGAMLPNNVQEIVSGIRPGIQIVSNALVLQNTVEQ